MKKEPANPGVVGTKKTGAVHHVKSAPKRVSADVEEKKRKTGGIMASAPPNMPLAVVVVEVQTSQNVKGKVGVESKVKKKSVTLKTTSLPVKKMRSPSPKKATSEESKPKQAKPKKVIATPIKTPNLKATKKADAKKPPKAPKPKSDKLTKKQKLAQEKQQQGSQQKKHSTPNESVPTSPITVVISEQDGNDKSASVSISCKKSLPKPAAKKQTKPVGVRKSGVAAGKIGKRKNIIKKTVAKEIGKAFKSDSEKKKDTEKSSEPSTTDQAPSEKNETNQPSKKASSNKKTKNDDAVSAPNLDLSSTTIIDKSKTIAKTVKFKGTDKPKAVKAKKTTKDSDEQSEENQDDSVANESTDTASKAESRKKEKSLKIDKSKVASEKKNTTDLKKGTKKEDTKTKKPKAESKSSSNQQQKTKAKGKVDTVGKIKKTVKVEDEPEKQSSEEKTNEPSDHNDSSTSDELPLELIKKQQKGKPQIQSEKTEQVIKPSISVKEEKIAFEECVKIKEEIDDLYDFKSSDGDCKVKDELLIKEETVKGASEKKGIKSTNKVNSSERVVKKNVVKKPLVKPGAVKVGVKGKAAANTKAAKVKAAKISRKVSSDDGAKSENQESSDDAKKNKKLKKTSSKSGSDSEKRARRMKLFGFWSGPKKHRVASLNALAKVHCLYENESRVMEKAMIEMSETSSPATKQPAAKASETKASKEKVESKTERVEDSLATTRTLRSNPGLRSVGRHYDVLNASSTTSSFTSSDDSSDGAEDRKKLQLQPSVKQKQQNRVKKQQEKQQQKAAPKPKIKPKQIMVSTDGTSEEEDQKDKKAAASSSSSSSDNPDSTRKVKKRRKRNELMMDLKDMVVRKRMASLNASAILAASYSMEKRSSSSSNTRKEDSEEDSSRSSRPERKRKSKTSSDSSPDMEVEDSSCEEDVLIRGGGSKQKVAVIVNQDTDLTITGVYVNSTTRSTHHEGFCSIAGMQYRISSTSHTQTEATAVATETVLHTDHPATVREPAVVAQPGKSYTPLGALSSMQPPGHGHGAHRPRGGPPSPLARRPPPHHAPCSSTSAFSAPPAPPPPQDPAYVHGYYQPAGPLISHHHHHHSTTTTSSSSSQSVPSKLPPAASPPPSAALPATTSESSDQADSVVASGSSQPPPEAAPPVAYRYPPYHGYQYYQSPPASSLQYPPQPQSHYHQEICYSSPNPYPSPYFASSSHKSAPYPPPTYHHRRYVPPPPPQYYTHQEFYTSAPPSQQQMIVPPGGSSSSGAAPTSSSSSYPPSGAPPPGASDPGYPPPPPPPAPMVDGYHPPPPTYPYPAYSAGPPPACYTHSPPNRLAFIDGPTYQGCPCPMQSCPKNVYTGPLTGASKGSLKNHQSTTPLPPVALALPLEPPGAVGPPSPARGSAGMPPPPSPALATARNPNPPTQWNESPPPDTKNSSETGLLVISKVVTDSVLGIPDSETNCAAETLIALKESSILMPKVTDVKIEVDENAAMMSTYTQQEIAAAVDLKTMATNCRKRRRLNGSMIEVRRLSAESVNVPDNLQKSRPLTEVQERLVPCDVVQTNLKEMTTSMNSMTESKDDVENRLPTPPPTSASPTVPVLPRGKQQPSQHHPLTSATKRKVTDAGCELLTLTATSTPLVNSSSKCNTKKRKADSVAVKETKKKCTTVNINNNKVIEQPEVLESKSVEPEVKAVAKRKISKVSERRKSTSADRAIAAAAADKVEPTPAAVTSDPCDEVQVSQPKKVCRGRKSLEKSTTPKPAASLKGKNVPKNNATAKGSKKDTSPSRSTAKKPQTASNGVSSVEAIAEAPQIICNPKKTHPVLKWSNGWSWEGTPFKSKVFLTSDDLPVFRKCYPSMKHKGGDIISPRDCVLLKSGKSKLDLPFVAKVAALWENPEDGEMMMSLLWYYRPEHTDHGRRAEDNVDEIFASRHKDINSVACIEDKCFVLTFNEYCRYRRSVRRCEEGLTAASRVVPMLDGSCYPRLHRQPPGQVASDLVFFCRRVYDFRQRRLLKNPS